MAIALGETSQLLTVERELRGGVHRIESILLVDRLPPHDAPATGPFLEEVVEAPRARDVDQHSVDRAALEDGHLRLRDRPIAHHVAGEAAEGVEDVHARLEAFTADRDEFAGRPLEPGGRHPPVRMPHGGEPFPIPGVAPQDPVLHGLTDRQLVGCQVARHRRAPARGSRFLHRHSPAEPNRSAGCARSPCRSPRGTRPTSRGTAPRCPHACRSWRHLP